MQINEYLEKYQNVIYKTFSNALNNEKLSHAYLLSGSVGMPLKETAIFLGKSILCDERNPLACNNCITCLRIDENNYPDFMVFDGEANSIKKEDVASLTSNFNKSALEAKGIMIYVIHLVESMNSHAINALLKFLEEPGKNIFAFLTTENESKILPTIVSRCQVLRFRSINRELVINDALNSGVSEDDAQILSAFYNDGDTIKNIANDNNYKVAKTALEDQLNALLIGPDDAVFTCQRFVIPNIKTIESARLYLKMLAEVFQNILNLSVNENITLKCYDTILHGLLDYVGHIDKSLLIIMSSIGKLELHVNIPLILDHVIYEITREGK